MKFSNFSNSMTKRTIPFIAGTDCPALKAGEQISSKKKPFNPFRHFLLSPTADAGRKRLGLRVEMSMKD